MPVPLKALWMSLVTGTLLCVQVPGKPPQRANSVNLRVECSSADAGRRIEAPLTNVGRKDLYFYWSGSSVSYSVSLTDMRDELISLTDLGRNTQLPLRQDGSFRAWTGSYQTITLQPNEERIEEIPLSYLYRLPTLGGTFKLRVGRRLEYSGEEKHSPATTVLWCEPMTIQIGPVKD